MPPSLDEVIELQRIGCAFAGSPLYAEVLAHVATDVAAGGPCASVLAPYADAPPGDAVVLRLLAAVHELVLAGGAPDLARHYPSVGGTPGPGVGPAFLATVAAHVDEVAAGVERPNQTNEVGRAAVLLGGLLEVAARGLPLRLLEVGASGGLNLGLDRYRYTDGSWAFGPPDSPVRFDEPWSGTVRPPLEVTPVVVERRGCDLRPLDPSVAADRLRLRALLWPDQIERRARLDAALSVAAAHPVTVDRADAGSWVAEQLGRRAPGVTTVVLHSVVAQYLPATTREDVVVAIGDAGAAATADAPVAWLRMEPGGEPQAELRLTEWPGREARDGRSEPVVAGCTRLLARSGFHGPPVTWLDPPPP